MQIRLLGELELRVDGAIVPPEAWRRRRPLDLLKLIASHEAREIARDSVIDAMWPEKDAAAGGNNLHRALHDLRQIVGGDCVRLSSGLLRLGPGVRTDVEAFRQGLDSGDPDSLRSALALYKGDLCPADTELEWLASRRASLRRLFVEGSLRLARHQLSIADHGAAVSTLGRLLDVDSTVEEAYQHLMRAHAAEGRTNQVEEECARCADALDALDAEPSLETVRLRDQLVQREARAKHPSPAWQRVCRRLVGTAEPSPMHGREAEVAVVERVLAALFDAPERRAGGVLLVVGEAGTGKSRLASEVARSAGRRGAVILAGTTDAVSSTVPHAPHAEAWLELGRSADRGTVLDPFVAFAPSERKPQEDILRLFRTVEQALVDCARDRPLVYVIEDLHWADESSLQLFHHLARGARAEPWLIVGTCRAEHLAAGAPLHSLFANLQRLPSCHRITLQPLSQADTSRQMVDLLDAHPSVELAERVYRLGGGNPLFTEELVRAHLDAGVSSRADAIPETLSDVIHERLANLGTDAETFLKAAATCGLSFRVEWVDASVDLEPAAALAALEAIVQARLLEETDTGYRFRHALVKEAVYSGLSRERRKVLHGRIADALEPGHVDHSGDAAGPPRDHALLAHHLQSAGRSEEALPHLIRAGRLAMKRIGFQESSALFERALTVLDNLGEVGARRFAVLEQLGLAHYSRSNLDQALEFFDAAARVGGGDSDWRPSTEERARTLRMTAVTLLTAGRMERADSVLQEVISLLDPASRELPSVLYSLAQIRWNQGRHAEAFETARRIVEAAEAIDDEVGVASGYEMLALACHSLGEWQQGVDYLDRRSEVVGAGVDVGSAFDAHL